MNNRIRRKRRLRSQALSLAGNSPRAEEIQLVQEAVSGLETISVTDDGGDLGGGTINNVPVMTVGTAWPRGRDPFEIDETTLTQLVAAIEGRSGGVQCRCTHPELQEGFGTGYVDPILWLVGRLRNPRLTGSGESRQVRADVHLGTYADDGPNGRLGTRIKSLARHAPADCGMSVHAGFVFEERGEQMPLARVTWCSAVDFVGSPGANPAGLLSGDKLHNTNKNNNNRGAGEGTPSQFYGKEREMKLNERQRAYLASCGLAKDATAEQVETFLTGLKPEQKSYLESLKDDGRESSQQTNSSEQNGQTTDLTGRQQPPASATVSDEQRRQIAEQALAAERDRRAAIIALAAERNLPESWAQGLCDRSVSLAQATELAELAGTMNLVHQPAGSRVDVGEERSLSGLRPAITDAICLRSGIELYEFDRNGRALRDDDGRSLRRRQPHERASNFQGLSLTRMAQEFLHLHGVAQARIMSDRDILELAMTGRMDRGGEPISLAMSTSDFPSILGNVMRNTIRAMYAEAEQEAIWTQWCGRIVLPDYRQMDMTSVSEVPDLLLRPEGGEVRFATFGDGKEQIQVHMFSRGMRFTQQAQRNDTFGVFGRQIRAFAGAFVRLLDRGSTAVLTANAAMADNKTLFHTDHRNIPAEDAALSIATLSAARTALRTQKGMRTAEDGDSGPAILNIRLRTIMTSAAGEDAARVLIGSEYDPSVGVGVINPVRNAAKIVGNPYLDDAGATEAWYAQGDPNSPGGGVQVAFLQGEEVPETRTAVDFRTGDLEVVCEGKAGFKADDYRGIYRGHA